MNISQSTQVTQIAPGKAQVALVWTSVCVSLDVTPSHTCTTPHVPTIPSSAAVIGHCMSYLLNSWLEREACSSSCSVPWALVVWHRCIIESLALGQGIKNNCLPSLLEPSIIGGQRGSCVSVVRKVFCISFLSSSYNMVFLNPFHSNLSHWLATPPIHI